MKTSEMSQRQLANMQRVFQMPFADLYPLYLSKILKKNRSEDELRAVISWLTGYENQELDRCLSSGVSLSDFFDGADVNANAQMITGTVCGVKVQDIEDPLMRNIRYMDKLVDELALGRPLDKILRKI